MPESTSGQPTSPEGRARSSMNALRHGLTARVVVLPSEDMAAYKTFSKEIVDSLDPQTPVEASSPKRSPTINGASTEFGQ